MKNVFASLFLYCACLCFFNFKLADVYSEFGTGSREAEETLFSALQSSRLYVPYLNNSVKSACRAISEENQATAVGKIGELIKTYYASDHFKTRYNQWVNSSFPQTIATVSEKRKAEIHEGRTREIQGYTAGDLAPTVDLQIQMAETYSGMEKMLASLPAEQRAELKKQIEDGKKNIVFFKKLKPLLKSDFTEARKQYAAYLAEDQIAQEEASLAERGKSNTLEYNKRKDPKKVLKVKLSEFLDLTKDLDFSAQTKVVYNRQKFVNTAYESKNALWKFCYRIGKTPTTTARNFAQKWLTEL